MARAKGFRTNPRSNSPELSSHSNTLNGTGQSDVSTSDSGVHEYLPAVRPKDHATVAEDGRHQKQEDDIEANDMAGMINNVSLRGIPGLSRGARKTRKQSKEPKDRSVSTGVNQKPGQHKTPTNHSSDRSSMNSRNVATSKNRFSRPETAFGDLSKKSRQSSDRPELFDVPQLSSRKSAPDATNADESIRAGPSHKDIAIEVEAKDFSDDINKLIPDSEDEYYEQQNNADLQDSSPARNSRSKTGTSEPLATHHYITRSRSANTADPKCHFKSSEQASSSESKMSPHQPKEPQPEPRPRRGPVPESTRQSSTSKSRTLNMGKRARQNNGRRVTNSSNSKESEDEEEPDSLKAMLESLSVTIGKLGQRKGVNGEMIVLDKGYITIEGTEMSKTIKNLMKSYTKMWETTSAEFVDLELTEKFHRRAINYLENLEEQCSVMLANRLGNHIDSGQNARNNRRTDMLRDIYIHLAPSLVDGLKVAGKPNHEPSKLTTENLLEFLRLLQILSDIAERTCRQDKRIQPKADGKVSYPLTDPTHLLRPILGEIQEKCKKELESRRLEELRRIAPARTKKRREREAEEALAAEEEIQQMITERNQRINAHLEEKRRILGLPPCSQPVEKSPNAQPGPEAINDEVDVHNELRSVEPERRRNMRSRDAEGASVTEEHLQQRIKARNRAIIRNEEERRRERRPPAEKPRGTRPRWVSMDDDERFHDDLQAETKIEVGLFGWNNLHPGTAPKEWTQSEIKILIDGLRLDYGPARYEKLAMRLDRTLDEIFQRAKYLKAQVEYTLKRLQEENPYESYPAVKPWIENIGFERYHAP